MQKSESIQNIAKALQAFQMKADKISRDANNPFFKKHYASLSNILDSIQIPLAESGLSFSQLPNGDYGLITILMHSDSGEYLMAEYTMRPTKDDPQGRGSAITYQRRYAIAAILGLNIEDDDDANAASGKENKKLPNTNGTTVHNNLPWLNPNTKQFDGAVSKIKAGQTDIPKIKLVMQMTKETETLLLKAINN